MRHNQNTPLDAAVPFRFHVAAHWRGASEFSRWTATQTSWQCFRVIGQDMKSLALFAATSFLLAAYPASAPALGTETFGHKTLNEQAYQEWPNLTAVINDTNRVYQYWVNGGEQFFFQGSTEALNRALQQFALVRADVREVVLLPGPANVSSLMRDRKFDYDWSLKINTGISRMMARGKGGLIWSKDPMLTVFIGGGNTVLDQIHVPKGLSVLEMSDLRKRYTQAIRESDEIDVRGWGACALARLDPSSAASLATVSRLLEDTNEWVRLNAVTALESFGKAATSSVPLLRQIAATSKADLRQRTEKAIAAIEAARDTTAADNVRSNILERISLFRKSLSQESER
jgi:hypothetical protein